MRQFYLFLVAILCTSLGFGQTTIFSEAGGGTAPAGWTFENNVTANDINRGSYWLVEDGTTNDFIITASYDLSSYSSATFTLDVATFGGGTNNSAKIEISDDGGSTYTQTEISNTPTSSSYIDGGTFALNSLTSQVVIKISSNGISGKDLRLRNLELVATGGSPITTVQFTSISSSVSESDGTIDLTFEITNEDTANATSFEVALTDGNGDASDINNYTTQTVTFAAGASTDETVTIIVTDDAVFEGDEILTFTITGVTGGNNATLGTQSTFDLTIEDNESSPAVTIIVEDFDGTYPKWNNDIEAQLFVDPTTPDEGLFIQAASNNNPSFSGNTAFGRDLDGESGEPTLAPYTFTFDNVDVSDYTSITVSFDYHAFANAETGDYEVVIDGVGQGSIQYFNDPDTSPGVNGTITVPVADGTSTVGLILTGTLNGGSDVIEFDNFKIGGIYNGLTYTDGSWSPLAPSSTTSLSNAIIVNGEYTLTTDVSLNDVFVYPAAAISIPSGTTLTANSLNLESNATAYASLILDGAIAGNALNDVAYHRFVNNFTAASGGNDLVASPLTGLTFFNFATDPDNTNLYANPSPVNSDEAQYLFGPYDNSSTLSYINYSIGLDAFGNADQSNINYDNNQVLTTGKGYRAATTGATGATLTFRGGVNSGIVTTTDFQALGNAPIDKWNLIGNPYPSYIDAQTFLTTNGGAIDESVLDPSFNAIYGYNDNTDNTTTRKWTIINNLQNNTLNIAPGQGFFVASNNTGQLNFTPAMRVSSGGDDFIQGRTDHTVYQTTLKLSQPNDSFNTDFYFTNAATQGLNPGYDAGLFGGTAAPFALYSHLVQDNQGVPFAIQALGGTDYTNVTIALGVNAAQGEQLTFSITASNLPNNAEVYLEDNVTNTYTLLSNNNTYVLTPNTDLNGTGRFFLHFTNNVLAIADNSLNDLNIYTNQNDRTVVISGELKTKTTARLYDLQGRLVITTLLNTNSRLQKINTTSLSTGIYIIKLNDKNHQNITQKIILK